MAHGERTADLLQGDEHCGGSDSCRARDVMPAIRRRALRLLQENGPTTLDARAMPDR